MSEAIRSFQFRLSPTAADEAQLGQIAGVCRYVYNLAWEQRSQWYRQYRRNTGRQINYIGQSYELTQLRNEVDWIAAVPRSALDESLADLERAYQAFFAGRARFPTPRKKSQNCGFRLRGRGVTVEPINAKWARVWITAVGWVKFRLTRPMPPTAKTVSFRETGGTWFISFACEIAQSATEAPAASVGIDRGIANTLALSTGELLSVPASLLSVERKRRRAQRVLSRRQKGSRRRLKQKARVAALHARARRIRADWAHRVSTDISRRFGTVAVEDLKIKNMVRNRHLARAIHHQGWGQVISFLAYKLEASGGRLIKVSPAYTSQTCSACGSVNAESRKSQAAFQCVECGHEDHADLNAAKNILRRSTAPQLAEGPRWRPVEPRTTRRAA